MRDDLPASIQESSFELSAEALVTLYEIKLVDNTEFFISPTVEYTWQGNTYEEIPCTMTDMSLEADGRRSRPKFSFANPQGLFTSHVYDGELDHALVKRIRILKSDLEANNDFKVTEQFKISKILNMNKDMIATELRDVLDGHNFILPARAFYPPDFPHVRLR